MTAGIINKTMDRRDLSSLEATAVVREIEALDRALRGRDLKLSSWYGVLEFDGEPTSFERVNREYGYAPLEGVADDRKFPWFLYCLLHPFFYRRVTRGDVWTRKREAIRRGQFGTWQFPLVKLWNDYTFGALFQEKPV